MRFPASLFLLFTLAFAANAQTGTWSGKIDVQGVQLPLVFHLDADHPTMDSPNEGVRGIPVEVERTEFDVLVHGGTMPQADELDLPDGLKQNYQALVQNQTPYFREFLALDVRPLLGRITCPVLALNGTLDTQVSCESNLGALRDGLPDNPSNRIESVEGVNHLFQHCTTGLLSEYQEIEETIAPEVLETMVHWLTTR